MAELLYRLGSFAARRAWIVIFGWVAILAIAVGGFLIGFKGLTSSFDVPGTASGDVISELEDKLPEYGGAAGTVVFATEDGSALTAEQRAAISALVASSDDLPDVTDVIDPFSTEQERADRQQQIDDGRTQIEDARAQLDAGQEQLDAGVAQLDAAQAQLDQALASGIPADQLAPQQAQIDAGRAQLDAEQTKIDDGRAELEMQSAQLEQGAELLSLADGIRVVSEDGSTALVNVAFSEPRLELQEASKQAVVEHFESEPIDGVEVSFSTEISQGVPQILGVGEVVGVALAGVILIVMLGSLLAASFPLITAILGVAVAALSTLAFSGVVQMASVTPVLGVMLGLAVGIDYALFIIYRHRKQLLQGVEVTDSIALANGTAGNAVVFAGSTVIIALFALNVTGIPFLGLMGTVGGIAVAIAVLIAITLTPALLGAAGTRILSRRARAKLATDAVAPPAVKPMPTWRAVVTSLVAVLALLVIAIPSLSMRLGLPDGSSEPADSSAYQAFTTTAKAFGEGANGTLLVTAELSGGQSDDEILAAQLEIARLLAGEDDVVAVAPIAVSDDGELAAFQVVPAEGPTSESTDALVRDLRGLEYGGEPLGVAGQAAINIDISEALADVLPLYLSVVIGLSFLIMIMVFRSLLVPLIATGGFILSLFATFGAITAVFQWGWGAEVFGIHSTGPVLSFLPVILVGILFGLAMDYQLFLATGMREAYVHGSPARLAVAQGFRAGRSVVIAAGLIMVAVFSGFITSESTIIKSLGFGLALGILLDAFLVRMLLMPALMHLLGRSAWWLPKWLDRVIPNVDVEGANLERTHPPHHTS
ncbi:MMPL family transporter [Microbacterium aoyamense]|uniref:MMPL family transporter n=1 Tax=Microbacterium aoyamense TaxID=344166 RepID=A0ABN2PYA8_9MICO|nr:MMPL family transporter [Microbacterium aoyamense]